MPTLVEVKRGRNPEIRRTIVGQMLEYAAHAARTWTADTLRRAFEESSDDPGAELGRLLQPDGDEENPLVRVLDRLAASRASLPRVGLD